MDTGVLKKITDVTMTTTRLTQFPTECVTGVTLERIMYETWGENRAERVNRTRRVATC